VLRENLGQAVEPIAAPKGANRSPAVSAWKCALCEGKTKGTVGGMIDPAGTARA